MPTPIADDGPELTVALHTISEFGEWIRSADSKAALLAAAQGLLISGSIGLLSGTHSVRGATVHLLEVTVLTLYLLALASSTAALVASHIPRLPTFSRNRLAFPTLASLQADAVGQRQSPDELIEQAWWQAGTLAQIAVAKYRWLRAAAILTLVALSLFLTCVWLTAAVGRP
jgi:hypothetical protein